MLLDSFKTKMTAVCRIIYEFQMQIVARFTQARFSHARGKAVATGWVKMTSEAHGRAEHVDIDVTMLALGQLDDALEDLARKIEESKLTRTGTRDKAKVHRPYTQRRPYQSRVLIADWSRCAGQG